MATIGVGRLLLVAAVFALIAAAPARTPADIVRSIYRDYIAGREAGPPESLYTPRLRALVANARNTTPAGDAPCGLDFVFWIDGQDEDIKRADVTEQPGPDVDTEIVIARFTSLSQPHELHFTFRRIAGRWRLDEAESVAGTKWVFSRLLKCEG